ncbi:hypothetical protein ACQPX6_14380 [Actinomycetospora sp. CA-101289]|uniref:hypothetical protein n=1 Tax=Actinomycetospora sp. CA-101289 TaxID=3239893 RepID=UPI003D97AC01
MRLPSSVRLPAPRPWVLRALVLGVVFGVAQTLFVALRSWSPDLLRLWSILLLVLVLAVVIVWAGAEVVLDRRPPEWSWFGAALAAAPGAGLLSWILLALFVDDTGVADLQAALVGRASFTALLILGGAVIGSRLGWLSLRRHGEGDDDPALDADDDAVAAQAAIDRADITPGATADERAAAAARAAARIGVRPTAAGATGPSVAGVRTPGRRTPERVGAGAGAGASAGPEVAERERMPEAARLAGQRRASRVRPASATTPVSSPFGAEASSTSSDAAPRGDAPESLEPPVVAVLPSFPVPGGPLDPETPAGGSAASAPLASDGAGHDEEQPRRRFGLRRPRD